MKKTLLISYLFLIAFVATAQWTEVSIGNGNAPISVLFSNNLVSDDQSVLAGTAGDGIFRTTDNGANWSDISGNIGNKTINFLDGAETIFFVGTQNGAYLTIDLVDYMDNTGSGLSSTDITFYGIGSSVAGDHVYAVGTNGGGLFTSDNMSGPWSDANTGISGDGLFINNLRGYYDPETVTYNVLATRGGVYFSLDGMASWTLKNNGLTGDALYVTDAYALGVATIISTHAGLFYSLDFGDTWINLIPDVKINKFLMSTRETGPAFFVFGESNMFSLDLQTWFPVDMSGYTGGEVLTAAVNSEYIFISPVNQSREGNAGGVMYKAPYDMVVGMEEQTVQVEAELGQNVPNPFSQKTEFRYMLKGNGMVSLTIFDLQGRKVVNLVNEFQVKGDYSKNFDAGNLPEGVYFYQLTVGNETVATRKMVIVK